MSVITQSLEKKIYHLNEEKRRIRDEYERKLREVDTEIEKINNAMKIIENAVSDYICPHCKGDGNVRRMDAAGQMCTETCEYCHGTGVQTSVSE